MKTEGKNTGLFCELYWGANLSEAWSFGTEQGRVLAAPDETVPLPLYGFTLPQEPYVLAEHTPGGWRIFPPPATRLEVSRRGDAFREVPASELRQHEGRPCLELSPDITLRLTEGQLSLRIESSVAGKRVSGLGLRDYAWLAVVSALFLSMPVGFLLAGPTPEKMAESNARAIAKARELEAAERKRLGVDTPARPISQEAQRDAGMRPLPTNLSVH
jgi:hypothetical protein